MRLFIVPPERIDDIWVQVEHYIASYVTRSFGRYAIEDIRNRIKDKTFQLWIAVDGEAVKAAAMTQVMQFPLLRELQIIMCAGSERHQWFLFLQRIEDYARDIGAQRISAISRPGWRADMKKLNYKQTHDYLEKAL